MTGMQWVTLAMYVIVIMLWLGMVAGVFRAGKSATRSAKKNLIIMSVIVLCLTALQYLSQRQ